MPLGEGYAFEAPTRVDRLFSGVVVPKSVWAQVAVAGSAHIRPEDVYGSELVDDLDYGRLLEHATAALIEKSGKRDSSPTGFEPVFWP
jgi:hypothetical protein